MHDIGEDRRIDLEMRGLRENTVGRPAPVLTSAAVYAIIEARETESMMAVASRLPLAVLRRRRVGYRRSFEAFLFVVMSHSGPAYAEEASPVPSSPRPAPAVSPEPIPDASLPAAPEGSPEAGAAASEKADAPAPGAAPPLSPEDLQPTEFAPATALDEAKRRAQSSAEDASDGDWTPAPATSSADLPGQGVRLHDGFYMRFSVGLSYLHGKTHEEGWGGESDWFSSTTIAKGWGPAGDALFGVSATRHLVLGVAFMLDYDVSPTATENGKYQLPRDSARRFFAGPFFDVFFDPSLGYHAGGAVGISTYTESYDGNDLDDGDALWLGATAWAGYDVWLLDQWSLGGLVRVSAGRADVADDIGDWKKRVTSKSIAVLLTVLNH